MKESAAGSSVARRRGTAVVLGLACLCALGASAIASGEARAAVPPVLLPKFCPNGSGAGQCIIPRGVATDPANGDVYISNQENKRVEKFDAWGAFERAWGWDVVESGPGDDTTPPEDQFEICVQADDVCKRGLQGDGKGEFGEFGPQGVAVGDEGNVYTVDTTNRRVQKFDPAGNFLLMFGGEVNKTKAEEPGSSEAERNLCTATSDDVCQAGTQGTGNGQFGSWPVGSFIAASPDGATIYVGDVGRIQKFDREGKYLGDLPNPGGLLTGKTIRALAAGPSGDLYLSREGENNVLRLNSNVGNEVCSLKVERPSAIAVDASEGVHIYSAEKNGTPAIGPQIVQFDSTCKETNRFDAEKEGLAGTVTGLAASSACGLDELNPKGFDLFVSNSLEANSFVRIYGPPPADIEACPPPENPPDIEDQYATSVGSEGATVRAEINPLFWSDTRYYVEYGLGECSEPGGCDATQPLPPGSLLTDDVINAPITTSGVFLDGLEPATTYHYRFVAESSGGGPVSGVGATAEETEGKESTFTTHALVLPPKVCANQTFRSGLSAHLPDCRAYEMVSPLDKNSGDIVTDETFNGFPWNVQLASPDGNRATYSSFRSFGSPEGAPYQSQYLSSRDAKAGWSTHSISPPRTPVSFYPALSPGNTTQFKAFSADLCMGWFIQDSDVALAPGAPAGVPNIYRRDDGDCGQQDYELITTEAPLGFPTPDEIPAHTNYFPMVQGVSADGSHTLLRADAALTSDACHITIEEEGEAGPEVVVDEGKGLFQVYLHNSEESGLTLISVRPGNAPACVHTSGGTGQGKLGEMREDSVYHALSADATRVFWSERSASDNQDPVIDAGNGGANAPGPLYVRLNPEEEQSPQEFGRAIGAGDVFAPAEGTGTVATGISFISNVKMTSGQFVVGQEISDSESAIPAGTTIVAIEKTGEVAGEPVFKLTLSAAATKVKVGDELFGIPGVLDAKATSGAFSVGQSITGPGISSSTTIIAVEESAADVFTLSLSADPTQSTPDAELETWSSCADPQKACTVPISMAPSTRFWGADPSGSTAIYTVGGSLFEYDVAAGESRQIAATGVGGVMGMSTDARRVYFASTTALTGEAKNERGEKAIAGKPNVYLYEKDASLVFVVTLVGTDVGGANEASPTAPITTLPSKRSARVSGDGLHAAFTSAAPLTGYDNTDVNSGVPDTEIFLYDASSSGGAGELACISCNPTGARPRGRRVLTAWTAAELPGWPYQLHPSQMLSEAGDRLFFESFEGLVLRDTNGKRDVYEWERAASAEDCKAVGAELYVSRAGGCISLISSGKSAADSEFIDASASGSDVFFFTDTSLVPQDFGLMDVYTAHENGGFPPPPTPKPPCEGEACQPAPPPPEAPTPASSAFQGAGNVTPGKSCGKGKRRVTRGGKQRCVKKKVRRAKHRRRSERRARR